MHEFLSAQIHALPGDFRQDRIWPFFQEDRKLKLQLAQQARREKQELANEKYWKLGGEVSPLQLSRVEQLQGSERGSQ